MFGITWIYHLNVWMCGNCQLTWCRCVVLKLLWIWASCLLLWIGMSGKIRILIIHLSLVVPWNTIRFTIYSCPFCQFESSQHDQYRWKLALPYSELPQYFRRRDFSLLSYKFIHISLKHISLPLGDSEIILITCFPGLVCPLMSYPSTQLMETPPGFKVL